MGAQRLLLRCDVTIDIRLDGIRPNPVATLVGMQVIAHDRGADRPIRLEELVAQVKKQDFIPIGEGGEDFVDRLESTPELPGPE